MFGHLFYYRFKVFSRSKITIFWTMAFPLILATLFKFAFGSITDITESYNTIPVGIVKTVDSQQNSHFIEAVGAVAVSDDAENDATERDATERDAAERDAAGRDGVKLFNFRIVSQSEADAMLEEKKTAGTVNLGKDITCTFDAVGIEQSIIRQAVEQFVRTLSVYQETAAAYSAQTGMETQGDAQNAYWQSRANESAGAQSQTDAETRADPAASGGRLVVQKNLGGEKVDSMIQYFYALIAMACLYGSFLGLDNSRAIQANISALGARRHSTPTNRLTLIFADTAAAFAVHFLTVTLICLYIRFILGIQIGAQPLYFILVCLCGSVIGVSTGQLIGTLGRKNESLKMALTLGYTMLSSMLGGLMFAGIKYSVQKALPLVGRINPVSLITDAFFCLTVYDDYQRFTLNIATLACMALIMSLLSFLAVRRGKYASL